MVPGMVDNQIFIGTLGRGHTLTSPHIGKNTYKRTSATVQLMDGGDGGMLPPRIGCASSPSSERHGSWLVDNQIFIGTF